MSRTLTLILLAFPIYFTALWCLILWLIALTGGWRKLASRYRQLGDFQGQILRYQSARLNWSNYTNILRVGLSERGLYLSPMVLFRPFHPPLFIPWEEIIAEPYNRSLFQSYQLHFRSVPGVRLELYQKTFELIMDFLKNYPDRLRLEDPDSDREHSGF